MEMGRDAERIYGQAKRAENRIRVFEDSRWEERAEVLAKLCPRTTLIIELTGTNVSPQRLKDWMDRAAPEADGYSRPRGKGQSSTAKNFLSSSQARYEAAYLFNLHYGAGGPESSNFETDLGAACDKRIETYLRYRSDLHENPADAVIQFETYIVLLQGINDRVVSIHTCKDCQSHYIWPSSGPRKKDCPICGQHQHDLVIAKKKMLSITTRGGDINQSTKAGSPRKQSSRNSTKRIKPA